MSSNAWVDPYGKDPDVKQASKSWRWPGGVEGGGPNLPNEVGGARLRVYQESIPTGNGWKGLHVDGRRRRKKGKVRAPTAVRRKSIGERNQRGRTCCSGRKPRVGKIGPGAAACRCGDNKRPPSNVQSGTRVRSGAGASRGGHVSLSNTEFHSGISLPFLEVSGSSPFIFHQ